MVHLMPLPDAGQAGAARSLCGAVLCGAVLCAEEVDTAQDTGDSFTCIRSALLAAGTTMCPSGRGLVNCTASTTGDLLDCDCGYITDQMKTALLTLLDNHTQHSHTRGPCSSLPTPLSPTR
ncbi:MAG: hypothetical protein ACRDTE_16290 [Pseudonocardiaceae bacterium]